MALCCFLLASLLICLEAARRGRVQTRSSLARSAAEKDSAALLFLGAWGPSFPNPEVERFGGSGVSSTATLWDRVVLGVGFF